MLAALLLAFGGPAARAAETLAPPDRFETARLVWTTLIAIEQADRTGNYSVLRDLAAPSFRDANDAARLAQIFARVRDAHLGLDRTVLLTPEFAEPPAVQKNGFYRVSGGFNTRPVGIRFDMLFQPVGGEWRLFGISVAPEPMPVPSPRPSRHQAKGKSPGG